MSHPLLAAVLETLSSNSRGSVRMCLCVGMCGNVWLQNVAKNFTISFQNMESRHFVIRPSSFMIILHNHYEEVPRITPVKRIHSAYYSSLESKGLQFTNMSLITPSRRMRFAHGFYRILYPAASNTFSMGF